MNIRNNSKPVICGLIVASTLALGLTQAKAADGILSKIQDAEGSYCHLKFPAIVPSTLGSDHPQLKDASSGDLIDYYGPCDHDPLGKDEIQSQEEDQRVRGMRNLDDQPFD